MDLLQGPHITRRGDIGLNARLPPGVPIPRPDKAYDFAYRTPTQSRREASDTWGDVRGRYSYVDDVGESHRLIKKKCIVRDNFYFRAFLWSGKST